VTVISTWVFMGIFQFAFTPMSLLNVAWQSLRTSGLANPFCKSGIIDLMICFFIDINELGYLRTSQWRDGDTETPGYLWVFSISSLSFPPQIA